MMQLTRHTSDGRKLAHLVVSLSRRKLVAPGPKPTSNSLPRRHVDLDLEFDEIGKQRADDFGNAPQQDGDEQQGRDASGRHLHQARLSAQPQDMAPGYGR